MSNDQQAQQNKSPGAEAGKVNIEPSIILELNERDGLNFLMLQASQLQELLVTMQSERTVSYLAAEQELKDIASVRETLELFDIAQLPPWLSSVKYATGQKSFAPIPEGEIESWLTSDDEVIPTGRTTGFGAASLLEPTREEEPAAPEPPSVLTNLETTLDNLPYAQKKIAVITYTIVFISYWINQIFDMDKPTQSERQQRDTFTKKLQLLQRILDKIDISTTITKTNEDMRGKVGPEAGISIVAPPIPEVQPGNRLWQAIKPIVSQPAPPGAKPILTPGRQELLETFLTTPKSMSELAREGDGLRSVAGVRKNLYTSLGRIWGDLPQEAKQGYQSPEEAIQYVVKSPIKTDAHRRKLQGSRRESWIEEKPRQTGKANKGKRYNVQRDEEGKKVFSDTHQAHLSEGALRRWQRQREMKQAQAQTANTPDQ